MAKEQEEQRIDERKRERARAKEKVCFFATLLDICNACTHMHIHISVSEMLEEAGEIKRERKSVKKRSIAFY